MAENKWVSLGFFQPAHYGSCNPSYSWFLGPPCGVMFTPSFSLGWFHPYKWSYFTLLMIMLEMMKPCEERPCCLWCLKRGGLFRWRRLEAGFFLVRGPGYGSYCMKVPSIFGFTPPGPATTRMTWTIFGGSGIPILTWLDPTYTSYKLRL